MRKNIKTIVGIDEVGRGPLAGPVAVGVVLIKTSDQNKISKLFVEARDSKKLSPEKREKIFKKIKIARKTDNIRYIVCYESSKVIDKKGINFAIRSCVLKCLNKLKVNPKETQVFLDGGLKAPKEFIYQKTIIRGDDKKKVISLASIVAKVSRDNIMKKAGKKFPKYGFEIHKGYGTLSHRKAISKNGLSALHRGTFCRNI